MTPPSAEKVPFSQSLLSRGGQELVLEDSPIDLLRQQPDFHPRRAEQVATQTQAAGAVAVDELQVLGNYNIQVSASPLVLLGVEEVGPRKPPPIPCQGHDENWRVRPVRDESRRSPVRYRSRLPCRYGAHRELRLGIVLRRPREDHLGDGHSAFPEEPLQHTVPLAGAEERTEHDG